MRLRSKFLATLTVAMLMAVSTFGAEYGPVDGAGFAAADLDRVQAGQTAPDFTLQRSDGTDLALSSLRGKNVVLVFYRGHW